MHTTCHFCSASDAAVNAPHWSGSSDREVAVTESPSLYLRVQVCGSTACRDQLREFPRRARRQRQPRPLYGDFATVAMLNGIATDGTGRRIEVAAR